MLYQRDVSAMTLSGLHKVSGLWRSRLCFTGFGRIVLTPTAESIYNNVITFYLFLFEGAFHDTRGHHEPRNTEDERSPWPWSFSQTQLWTVLCRAFLCETLRLKKQVLWDLNSNPVKHIWIIPILNMVEQICSLETNDQEDTLSPFFHD